MSTKRAKATKAPKAATNGSSTQIHALTDDEIALIEAILARQSDARQMAQLAQAAFQAAAREQGAWWKRVCSARKTPEKMEFQYVREVRAIVEVKKAETTEQAAN